MGGKLQVQSPRALPLQGGRQRPAAHGGTRGSGRTRVLKNSKKRANETPWAKPTRVRMCWYAGQHHRHHRSRAVAAGVRCWWDSVPSPASPVPPASRAPGTRLCRCLFLRGERLNGRGRRARSVPGRASRGAEGDELGPAAMPAGDRAQGVPRRTGQWPPPHRCQPGGRFLGSQSIVTAPAFENRSR